MPPRSEPSLAFVFSLNLGSKPFEKFYREKDLDPLIFLLQIVTSIPYYERSYFPLKIFQETLVSFHLLIGSGNGNTALTVGFLYDKQSLWLVNHGFISPAPCNHVISRGNQKRDIFLDEKALRTFLYYLSEYKIRENLWGQALDIWISNKSSRILFINRFRSVSLCASCSSSFAAVLNVEGSRRTRLLRACAEIT